MCLCSWLECLSFILELQRCLGDQGALNTACGQGKIPELHRVLHIEHPLTAISRGNAGWSWLMCSRSGIFFESGWTSWFPVQSKLMVPVHPSHAVTHTPYRAWMHSTARLSPTRFHLQHAGYAFFSLLAGVARNPFSTWPSQFHALCPQVPRLTSSGAPVPCEMPHPWQNMSLFPKSE